jgi:hypothetical protein
VTRATLIAANRTEVGKTQLRRAEFAEFQFPSGTIRITTADRNITWGGFTWLANAGMAKSGNVIEAADLKARRTTFSLSGLDSAMVTRILADNFSFATVKAYIGFFDDTWTLVGTPYTFGDSLLMSGANLQLDQSTGVVELSCETWAVMSQRDSAVLATPQSQKLRYPGDTGQDRMAYIFAQVVIWGGAPVITGAAGTTRYNPNIREN